MRGDPETASGGWLGGAVVGIVVVAALVAGGYWLKRHNARADREADHQKIREEHKRNADPAKVLRDAQRMEETSRKRAEQQREQPAGKPGQ
jgi:FtsZ-interacting cell division protein ZipA